MNIKLPVVAPTAILLSPSKFFMAFAVRYVGRSLKPDYPWAALCIMGAVYFVFRS